VPAKGGSAHKRSTHKRSSDHPQVEMLDEQQHKDKLLSEHKEKMMTYYFLICRIVSFFTDSQNRASY